MAFTLYTHENQHGYGVSLFLDDEGAQAGFVLQTFTDKFRRDEYARQLAETFSFPIESLNGGPAPQPRMRSAGQSTKSSGA